MLNEYLETLDNLEAELFTDMHCHECEHDIITVAYVETAISAVNLLKDYIKNMNAVYDAE